MNADSDKPLVLVVGGGAIGSGAEALYAAPDVRLVAFDLYASENVQLIADAHHMPFADASFDGVWVQAVLEHVLEPQVVVDEIGRVLRPGGLVVIADHARDVDPAVAAWVEEIERLRDPSHWACLTPERLRQVGADPGLELDLEEGAGEVQTPLTGHPAALLEIGDLVWFRHAKSGELFEHTNSVRLLAGDVFVDEVPTYRGCGHAW